MKPITILITAILICIVLVSTSAQTIDYPEYTIEERWERAAMLYSVSNALFVRQEMEAGKTVEEIGQTIATILGPGWSGVTTTAMMARAMHRNWLIWPEAEFVVDENPDGSVTIQANRPYKELFGKSGILYDVKLQDADIVWYFFYKNIAKQQGMEYYQSEEDGWLMIKISSK